MKTKSRMPQGAMKSLLRKIILRFLMIPLFLGIMVLLPSGTFHYWQAYVYLVVLVAPMIFVLFYFIKIDPMFLERRTRVAEKDKNQKFISLLSAAVFITGFMIPGFDRRFGWSSVPTAVVLAADAVILLGYLLIFFVFRQNSYASRIIEISKNQKVITGGLYGLVRHPMYLGVLIMFIPTPVALGSYWGLIPMALLPLALVLRILNEEKMLTKNLKGYKAYCRKTRFRLIPYVW